MGSTKITDRGLVTLAKMPAIHTLWLLSTSITDEGLEEPPKIKHLEAVYLSREFITPAAIDRLKRRMPELDVTVIPKDEAHKYEESPSK